MDVESLADFVAVVQGGSISAGARLRGQPKQTVSRRVMALEQQLGVRLLDRGTRALRLTAEGTLLHERAERILADLDETRRALADRHAVPEGLLRISAPMLLGQTLLGAVIARLVREHPKLRIEAVLSDRRVDIVEDGFDAAIRAGPMDDSKLVGRVFARAEMILVASPAWLRAQGAPKAPRDLARMPCVLFGHGIASATWRLARGADREAVEVQGPVTASSLKLALDVARGGAGMASVPAFLARDFIDAGELERVLPAWTTGVADLRVVFPSRRLVSARLRVFIDALAEDFSQRSL
jgi:DNA-binding transcriptional LysR family regulator